MTPIFSTKKLLVSFLCLLLATGAWVPLVGTDDENGTTDPDPAREVMTGGIRGGGNGTRDDPYLITDVDELQAMKDNLTVHYALANDIDASTTRGWNDGAGFEPVAPGPLHEPANHFTGSLDGRNHTITGLCIDRPSLDYVGLFGCIGSGGSVSNVGLVDADITGRAYVGGLVGGNRGSVSNCYATGTVSGDRNIGGLVGENRKSISNSYATGSVTGDRIIGGLVGQLVDSGASLSNSYATGSVSGTGNLVGGLVGQNWDKVVVSNCYATGDVSGNQQVGGLVGGSGGSISNCYAEGSVIGTVRLGGLVGWNAGSVSNCYATGRVTRSSGTATSCGGFAGENYRGKIINCYSTGSVQYDGTSDPTDKGFCGSVDTRGAYEMSGNHWDMETSGQATTAGEATGMTTADMKREPLYLYWDFDTIWDIVDGYTYPWLRSFPQPLTPRILSPRQSGTLVQGDSLRFTGAPFPDPKVGYLWDFCDGRSSPACNPGLVRFPEEGARDVSFSYVMDGGELSVNDTRTFTVVDDAPPYPDLSVVEIDIPDTLALSEPATIAYTVRNIGDAPLTGESWHDAVYLSRDPYLDDTDRLLTSVAVSDDVAAGGTYQGSLTVTFPPVEEGSYYLILSINDGWSFIERRRLNNEKAEAVDIAIPRLQDGVAHTGGFGAGLVEQYFRIDLSSGTNLLVTLTGTDNLEFFLGHGSLPTRTIHDERSGNGRLVIPAAYAGIWYVLVRGDRMPRDGSYTITYETVHLILDEASPGRHVSGIPLELMLTGAGFIAPVQVELIEAGGTPYQADLVEIHSLSRLTSFFGADILPEGTYSVRATRPDKGTAELHGVLWILARGEAKLETRLILPQSVGYNALATFHVEYENSGDLSMPAPLLTVTGVQNGHRGAILTLDAHRLYGGIWTSAMPEGFSHTVQFLASGATPGILRSGEFSRVPVYYAGWQRPWDPDEPPIEWHLGVLGADNDVAVSWGSMKDGMRPSYIRPDAWEVTWSNFIDQAGDTWGDYVDMLGRNARYLDGQGQRVEDINLLLAFSFRQADGFSPLPFLANGVDATIQAPGLPVVFERSYLQPISRRFETGPLGRGWVHTWQFSLDEKEDGTVVIRDMTGTPRIFQPDIRYHGRYLARPGDRGSLRALGEGRFSLVEQDGLIKVFTSGGKLDHVEDPNGNRITCEYNGSLLIRLTHSSRQYLDIDYDNDGRITRITSIASITDTHGREVTYTYSGEYLTSAQAHDGYTVTYEYNTGGGSGEHALTGIHLPGERKTYLEYDGRGYLSATYREGGGEKLTFAYDLGTVTVTDLLNNAHRYSFDHAGRRTRVENPLGEAYHYLFGETAGPGCTADLRQVTDPAGHTTGYSYDLRGNRAGITDPMGRTTRFYYSRTYNQLVLIMDAIGTGTRYGYDGSGNPIEIVYADGSRESWSHDPGGTPASWTNRRNDTIEYSYDPAGRLTEKIHSDNTRSTYTYDGRGNLIRIDDPSGTTEHTYDDDDRLVRIDYPGDRWLEFTYDAARRRTSSLDQLGYRLNYHYDPAGRIANMTDGSGFEVVRYEYDIIGRLSRKTVGNGVSTTYEYDSAGRITGLINYAPDNEVLSHFYYTYDRRGLRMAMHTHYGNWTYEYDDSGQLIRALLTSTDPAITDQELVYEYDALGNRIQTAINGEVTEYESNRLNQYVRIGDRNHTYDADGNLIREEGPAGVTTYTYNDENRLLEVTRGNDTWQYIYDALGHRVALAENGLMTHYVVDPIGSGNVVGEYDADGNLFARYTHGFGLINRMDAAGDVAYYTYDVLGNVMELTGTSGVVENAYVYRPFGEILLQDQNVPNPFRFVGEWGVMWEANGLGYMRARYYDPEPGRFITRDPLGLAGGDVNVYRYVCNLPTTSIDPAGGPIRPIAGRVPPLEFQPEGGTCPFEQAGKVLPRYCALSTDPVVPPDVISMEVYRGTTAVWGARDPNRKLGPSGYGAQNFTAGNGLLPYRVDFENLEDATAPAQIVTIRDPLSGHFDWTTFEFTQVGFGDVVIPLNTGTRYLEKVVDYHYTDEQYDMVLEVHINGGIDMAKGEIYLDFYSIDPETGLPPSVDKGFLPPEDGNGRGQGYFTYLIRPGSDLPTGTEIRNIATIQFDLGLSIDTNQIDPLDKSKGTDPDLEALVTMDAGPPTSRIDPLPGTSHPTFEVSWSGQDDEGGSGIGFYDIHIRENHGPWTLWLERTSGTSAYFDGEANHTYCFYSIAIDNVGHREDKPATAEATTTAVARPGPTANAGFDQTVNEGEQVTFDGGASTDDIGIVNYTWTFHDGIRDITLYGMGPAHTFTVAGVYLITLNVANVGGLRDTDTMTVTVNDLAPEITFHAVTLSPERPKDGDTVTLTVTLKNTGDTTAQSVIAVVKIDGNVIKILPLGDIPAGGTVTAEQTWTVRKGTYILEVDLTYTGGEDTHTQTFEVGKKGSDSPGFEVVGAVVAVGVAVVAVRKKRS